jgi:hypothetical protein
MSVRLLKISDQLHIDPTEIYATALNCDTGEIDVAIIELYLRPLKQELVVMRFDSIKEATDIYEQLVKDVNNA